MARGEPELFRSELFRADEADREALSSWSERGVPEVAGLPDDDALVREFIELAIPFDDHEALLGAASSWRSDPARHEALRFAAGVLVAPIGHLAGATMPAAPRLLDPPAVPEGFSDVLAGVLAAPHTRAWFRGLGVDEAVVRASLADLGRNVLIHGREHRRAGFSDQQWLQRHWAGRLVELGRLQFELSLMGRTYAALINEHSADELGAPVDPAEPVLSLHIPRYAGSLSPQRVDAAIAAAREHFSRHHPDLPIRVLRCTSWLLDPQLRDVLSASSNITGFAERFTRPVEGTDKDEAALRFVFDDPRVPLDEAPRDTSLQRGIVDHLRGGGHWREVPGWFRVDWTSGATADDESA